MSPSGAPKILVADRDPSVRSLLAAVVRHMGFDPLLARDAAAAIELLGRHDVEAAIVDPATGLSSVVSDLITAKPGLHGKIIVITTGAAEKTAEMAAVLRKPFHLSDLRDALHACCMK